MADQRLIRVVRDKDLLQQFDSYVRIIVSLSAEATEQDQLALEKLMGCWASLGFYGAMPDDGTLEMMTRLGTRGNEMEARQEIFGGGGAFRTMDVMSTQGGKVTCLVEWGGLHEDWLNVLLNCLEGYHMQVARIELVELSANGDV